MFRILIDVNLIGRLRGFDVASLGSDRFRIFSAQAKGAFQCHEISPRVRFALRVKKVTATKLTVGTSIHGQVCENPPELTPSSIDCTKRTLSGRTDLINRRAKYSRQVSDRAPIRRQWPLTFPWSRKVPGPSVRNQWSRSFVFSENLIAPDKSLWPKHCVTLS